MTPIEIGIVGIAAVLGIAGIVFLSVLSASHDDPTRPVFFAGTLRSSTRTFDEAA